MDGFNDAFGAQNELEADPAAEFLAREQSNLAGLEDDIPPPVVTNGAVGSLYFSEIVYLLFIACTPTGSQ